MNNPEEEPPLIPPSFDRVVRRAFCLSAVVCRSFIDQPDNEQCISLQSRIKPWLGSVNAESELELWEADALNSQLGTLDPQTRANASWASEGLAVLAWALGLFDMPPHDECVDPQELTSDLDFLQPSAIELFEESKLRSSEDIQKAAKSSFAVHWRLRQFSLVKESMNFAEFAKTAWFGPLDIEGIALLEDDLAIEGQPISKATADSIRMASSIAMERHKAFNWLLGYDEIYSEVDTST